VTCDWLPARGKSPYARFIQYPHFYNTEGRQAINKTARCLIHFNSFIFKRTLKLSSLNIIQKRGMRPPGGERDFLGKLCNKIELLIIIKMSETDCLHSFIASRHTALPAVRPLRSIKNFLQSLRRLNVLKSSVTKRSCSFLTFGDTVSLIYSCFVCPPRLNNWHSLPQRIYLQPTFSAPNFEYCRNILLCWLAVKFAKTRNHFWSFVKCGKIIPYKPFFIIC